MLPFNFTLFINNGAVLFGFYLWVCLFQVFIYNDDFIRRAKGKRKEGMGKDSSLGAYI